MSRLSARVLFLLAACALLGLALVPAAASASPAFNEAADQLLAHGYPQGIVDDLCGLGTMPLGMRTAGDSADDVAARYIADELRAMGMSKVRLEAVPVDEWEFRGASVTVGGVEMAASSWVHMQSTPPRGITAPLVYAHGGTAEDFDAAGDVRGKLVLIDAMFGWWYPYYPWAEATLRGALGIVTTGSWKVDGTFWNAPDALGCFPAEYDRAKAPAVWLSPRNGDRLKDQLAAGPVTATMKIDADFTPSERGGTGYNVVAELPGSAGGGTMVVWSAHHDAFWRGALDDTSAVAQLLTVAKAARISGYRPARTWVFVFTTAEESSKAGAYYDWLYGSWWAIARAHPDWAGRIAGQVNLEMQGGAGPLWVNSNVEIGGVISSIVRSNPLLTPFGSTLEAQPNSWNDQFPFIASGVPAATFSATTRTYDATIYHTPADTPELIDWSHFRKMQKLEMLFAERVDTGLLPYDLPARAGDLAAAADARALKGAGADPALVDRLSADVVAFQRASAGYAARAASIRPGHQAAVNAGLLAVEKDLLSAFTCLDVWEQTIYPHEQVLLDVQSLDTAQAELGKVQPNPVRATTALESVSQNWYGPYFSPDVYAWELTRHQPDSPNLYFGELCKIARLWNVMPQYRMIEAGRFVEARAGLLPMRNAALADLNARVAGICAVLETVTPKVEGLR